MARPDFPKTLDQFQAQFRDEAACRGDLAACRWPDGYHLQVYLDEFTFRFNRRRTPMAAFQTLLGLATLHGPTTYDRRYASE